MCCGGAADRVGTRFARNGARHDEDARGRTETRARSGRSISPPSLVQLEEYGYPVRVVSCLTLVEEATRVVWRAMP